MIENPFLGVGLNDVSLAEIPMPSVDATAPRRWHISAVWCAAIISRDWRTMYAAQFLARQRGAVDARR